MPTSNVSREPASDRRELSSGEIQLVSGGLTATMIWGSNVVSVSSSGVVLVSSNGGKSGAYSSF